MDRTPEEKEVCRLMLLLHERGFAPNPRTHFDWEFFKVWAERDGVTFTGEGRTISEALAKIEEESRQ